MTKRCLAAIALAALAAAAARAEPPSDAFLAMQGRFEERLLAATEGFDGGQPELLEIAGPIAESVYGADWRVVAAESERLFADLPELDLASYADVEAEIPFTEMPDEVGAAVWARMLANPGDAAAMRFYDPETVGVTFAILAMAMKDDEQGGTSLPRVHVRTMMANQVFHTRLGDEEALAVRAEHWLVVIPYTVSDFGLIAPWMTRVRVYPRHYQE